MNYFYGDQGCWMLEDEEGVWCSWSVEDIRNGKVPMGHPPKDTPIVWQRRSGGDIYYPHIEVEKDKLMELIYVDD